jgi:hypothetical protein
MPLLSKTRATVPDDIAEAEDLLDRWIAEVGNLVESAVDHMASLSLHNARLAKLRTGFAAAREKTHAHT